MAARCLHCGAELGSPRSFYCRGGACKQRAYRRRKSGVRVDSYRGSRGLRGSAPLGVMTRREELDELLTVAMRAPFIDAVKRGRRAA